MLGGDHDPANLIVLCAGHHRLLHDGMVSITGRAPDELLFMRGELVVVDSRAPRVVRSAAELCQRSRIDDVALLERATRALVELGYRRRQARELVKQARADLGASADIPAIAKYALATSRQQSAPRDASDDATQALVQLGYPRAVAAAAIEGARAHVGTNDLTELIRQALRQCSTS